MTRFVVTGSGRCGTRYVSRLLSAAGVRCGHEQAFNADGWNLWTPGQQADSSWMAATALGVVDVPVVLLVRHPLRVVASWVEIGFFSHDLDNPTHGPLRRFAPEVYQRESAADRALEMWLRLTDAALSRAELVLRLERLDAQQLARLLRWAGCGADGAAAAFRRTKATNRHENMRRLTGIRHEPTWDVHDEGLAVRARSLARLLGYDPEVTVGG